MLAAPNLIRLAIRSKRRKIGAVSVWRSPSFGAAVLLCTLAILTLFALLGAVAWSALTPALDVMP